MKQTRSLACLLVLGLLAGCGTGPESPTGPTPFIGAPSVQLVSVASGWIGPDGGSLSAGGVLLTVPDQAATKPVWVSLSVSEVGGGYHVVLEPAGATLAKAATLFVPCSGGCRLLWLNPSSGVWEDLATTSSPGGVQARVIQLSTLESDGEL